MSTAAWIGYVLFASACIGGVGRTLGKWACIAAILGSMVCAVADTSCMCCHRVPWHEVPNPYRVPQLQVLAALVVVGAWWRRVRPRVRSPRLAIHLAGMTMAGALGQLIDAHIGWLAVSSGGLLVACLLVDLRFHVPPITPAVARVVAALPRETVARPS